MSTNYQGKMGKTVATVLFGLAVVFCSTERVPRWGILHLGWPAEAHCALMAACGAVAGMLLAAGHRLPGLLGGLAAGPGCLLAMAFLPEWIPRANVLMLVLAGIVGTLPGLGLYAALAGLQGNSPEATEQEQERERERVRANARAATTEDLLNRVTAYRGGMDPEALKVIEEELRQRGVGADEVLDHADQAAATVLCDENGIALMCSYCHRPAVAEDEDPFLLWGGLLATPVFGEPVQFNNVRRCCAVHRPAPPHHSPSD